jgi:branched-subunit amino acid ABC-type transport system permease component
MVVSKVLEAVIYGLSLGMIYIMVALGLTLIFGLLEVVNFAHGAFVTMGAYIGISTIEGTGSFWLAIPVAAALIGGLGIALERIFLRRLYGTENSTLYELLLTFAIALFLDGLVIIQYGTSSQRIDTPNLLQGSPIPIGPTLIPRYRIFIILFTTVLILGIWLFLQRTKLGLIVKAGMDDRERVKLLGIRLSRVQVLMMGVGSALAAISGILAAPVLGAGPTLGTELLIISFAIVIIGGLGDIRGAIVAGLLIGIINSLSSFFYPTAAGVGMYLLMIVVLLLRPQGIIGGVEA